MTYGVGQPVRRKEDVRLVSGRGRYLDDIRIEGEVHAYFVRSPHAHANIRGVEASAALAAPGVIGVLTADDVAGTGALPVRGSFKSRDGSELKQSPKLLLPADKARFAGEAVAMIVAQTPAQAKDAAELVEIDYETLPANGSLDAAHGAPRI